MNFDDREWSDIMLALHVAAEVYEQYAKNNCDTPRLRMHFEDQAKDARRLHEKIEEEMGI